MKTRIISGIVMGAVVAAVLVLGFNVSPYFITVFVALAAAVGSYELIGNCGGLKNKLALIGSAVYTALMVVALDGNLKSWAFNKLLSPHTNDFVAEVLSYWGFVPYMLSAIYFVFAVFVLLKKHKDFDLAKVALFTTFPIILSYAFSTLCGVINRENGIYYLLLLFNFSSVCDMGAYFVGVTCGKHKLCPEISPKKTVEGALGGIVSSIVVGLILVFAFGHTEKLLGTVLLTVPLCIIGMAGDLFASIIKRRAGIKDYGTLIPGHGGVLDRVDSILLIAPVLNIFVTLGVL